MFLFTSISIISSLFHTFECLHPVSPIPDRRSTAVILLCCGISCTNALVSSTKSKICYASLRREQIYSVFLKEWKNKFLVQPILQYSLFHVLGISLKWAAKMILQKTKIQRHMLFKNHVLKMLFSLRISAIWNTFIGKNPVTGWLLAQNQRKYETDCWISLHT